MKIIRSGKADELKQKRDEWKALDEEQNAKFKKQEAVFNDKMGELITAVKQQIEAELSVVDLKVDVRVERAWIRDERGLRVNIQYKDWSGGDADTALRWSWDVNIDENGEPKKETSSWSGLKATTYAQIEDLKKSVQMLELLNNMDWVAVLDVALPRWEDYITERSTIGPNPVSDRDIYGAELDDIAGTNTLVKGYSPWGYSRRGQYNCYHLITKTTAAQLYFIVLDKNKVEGTDEDRGGITLTQYIEGQKAWANERTTKEKFISEWLVTPIETLEF